MLFNITQHTRAKPFRNAMGIIFSIAIASTTGVLAQKLNTEIRKYELFGSKDGQREIGIKNLTEATSKIQELIQVSDCQN